MNVTVSPVRNETSRAVFACTVNVSDILPTLLRIRWYYERMEFGSGMGIGPAPMSGLLMEDGNCSISIFEGTGGVNVSKTSVLVLDNVGFQHEGHYRCVATFQDGQVITSRNATLIYNSKLAL